MIVLARAQLFSHSQVVTSYVLYIQVSLCLCYGVGNPCPICEIVIINNVNLVLLLLVSKPTGGHIPMSGVNCIFL